MNHVSITMRLRRSRRAGVTALALAMAMAAVVAAIVAPTARPAFPGQNGKIAFSCGWQICVMNADGSGKTQLTDDPTLPVSPAWSPDGQKIAFQSYPIDSYGYTQISVMDADGSNQARLSNSLTQDESPAWSPDGQKIAFSRNDPEDATLRIYVMNADGSGLTRLTDSGAVHPAWSPDGQKIAFVKVDDDGDVDSEIYVMNVDGSGLTRLTNDTVSEWNPAWSPDGQRIAFATLGVGPWQISVMNVDGSGQTRLTNDSADAWQPAWSPDGQKLAFTCGTEVCLMDADGSNRSQLTTTGGYKPDWQPLAGQSTRTATVRPPINTDGSSVFKSGNGVLPVKFTLAIDGVATCELRPATIALTKLSGAVTGSVNESEYTLPSDSGSAFRVDDCQYVYNLSLKSLSPGIYRVEIDIDSQSVGSAAFELR